jgi:hypothetical protein
MYLCAKDWINNTGAGLSAKKHYKTYQHTLVKKKLMKTWEAGLNQEHILEVIAELI